MHNATSRKSKFIFSARVAMFVTSKGLKFRNQRELGPRTPMESFDFRDRFLCDLIDYRMDPCKMDPGDDNSATCSWMFVLKDHFTRLVCNFPSVTLHGRSDVK